MWPRQESNLDLELRKLLYYPLYYEASCVNAQTSQYYFQISLQQSRAILHRKIFLSRLDHLGREPFNHRKESEGGCGGFFAGECGEIEHEVESEIFLALRGHDCLASLKRHRNREPPDREPTEATPQSRAPRPRSYNRFIN